MEEKKKEGHIPELEEKVNILGRWASFFIDRYRIVYLMIAAILVWGITAYFEMKRELQPEVVLPYGYVLTTYPGAAPEEVERLLTDKIEKKMDEISKVKQILSTSGYGYSMVFVEFETGVDIDDAVQKMKEKVSSIQKELPADAETPEVNSFETNNAAIMIINVSGDYDLMTLKSYGEKIKEDLEKLKEVSSIQIIGGLEREIKIIVDPQKLSAYNLSLEQIKNAIMLSNVNFPGGNIQLDKKNYNIRTVGEMKQAAELKNVVLTYMNNSPLYLKDVAVVEDGHRDPESYSRMSYGLGTDQPAVKQSVAIAVKKKEAADIIKTSQKIHDLLEKQKGHLYPENLQIEVSGDTAVYVKDELGTVINNSKSGLLLVITVLFLFIGFAESLVVSFVIPLSILVAFGMMKTTGMTFNSITMFSLILAVGMLVDNGIVIMENIDRLRFKGLSSEQAAKVGTNQIAPAIAASTLTTLAAFFPIMLTPGVMGAFIKPIPQTVMFALGASFLVSVTITPALCTMALKGHRSNGTGKTSTAKKIVQKIGAVLLVFILTMYAFKDNEGGLMGFGTLSVIFGFLFAGGMILKLIRRGKTEKDHFIIRNYGERLYKIIQNKWRRRAVIAIILTAFLFSMALIPLGFLKVEMFATTDFTRLYVNIKTPNGTSLDTTSAITEEVERRLFQFKEIKSFVSNIGMIGADSIDEFQVSSGGTPNIARVIIDLVEEKERKRSSMEISAEMRKVLEGIPGAEINVQEMESGPPSGKAITVRIKGERLEDIKKTGDDFVEILKGIPGTLDVKNGMAEGTPEIQVHVDKERAARYGLENMTIATGIRNAVHGLKATTLRSNQEEIDVVIRTSKDKLETIKDLEKIYFYSRSGYPVAFSQVASIVEGTSILTIGHEDLKRQTNITADLVAGYNAADITKEFQTAIADYPLLEGITIEYGGEVEDMQESFTDMFRNMIIAAILVFLILAIQFNSLSQPLIILFTVPMALIGVMPGHVITGNNFGFVSFIGVVALVGIAVNDAIVLVDYINYLRKNGYELYEAVKETGMTRFIPVMATTITTVGGILPITLRQPFFAPLGYALIFGLGVATVLTLIVIPVLYVMLEEFKGWRKNRKNYRLQKGVGRHEEAADITPAQ
ncbi:efflux RND transporter permease subunit [Geosporobacter ferrireducens]|uniref:efflux RND transporter permease subunit n=1 Tax=Geosporobacter ferrireducens TaxID=1424294 RepID=UPI00139CBB89|nr:efflux RND transporter permease subunit [Geosporobacter ferrireducens]MTI57171.1 efflux RND transporter permease subunit [Geosporobacter ferrireducens]